MSPSPTGLLPILAEWIQVDSLMRLTYPVEMQGHVDDDSLITTFTGGSSTNADAPVVDGFTVTWDLDHVPPGTAATVAYTANASTLSAVGGDPVAVDFTGFPITIV